MDITYRLATTTDSHNISQLVNLAFRNKPEDRAWTSDAHLIKGERTNPQMVSEMITKKNSFVLLALIDDGLVGCVHFNMIQTEAFIGTLSVSPTHQDYGIGKSLGEKARQHATEKLGATHFITHILTPRTDMILYALRIGYGLTGRLILYPNNQGYGQAENDKLTMTELRKRAALPPSAKRLLIANDSPFTQVVNDQIGHSAHSCTSAHLSTCPFETSDIAIACSYQDAIDISINPNPPSNNRLLVASTPLIVLMEDRFKLYSLLLKLNQGQFVPKMSMPLAFPFLIRKRFNSGACKSLIINSNEAFKASEALLTTLDYFAQVLVPSPNTFSTHLLIKDNIIIHSTTCKHSELNDITDKSASVKEELYCPHLPIFLHLLNKLGFSGFCSITYIVIENRPLLLSITPYFTEKSLPYLTEFIDALND